MKRHLTRTTTSLSVLCAGALLLSACGTASDGLVSDSLVLQVSSGVSETHPGQRHMQTWSERVTELTDGQVEFDFTYSGALLPIEDEIPGVGDGRADMAYGSPHYNTSLLPLTTVGQLPFITRNSEAQLKGAHDLLQTNEAVAKEWEDANVKPLFQALIGSSLFGASEEITSIDDLAGLKVRAFGEVGRTFEAAGATSVSIPFPELYESAQRGVVDSISGLGFTGFESGQLYEVAPFIHDTGHGESIAFQTIVINSDVYASLDDAALEAFETATDEYYEGIADLIIEDEDAACATMLEAGTEFVVWSDEEMERWDELVGRDIRNDWVETMEADSLPGQEVLDAYESFVAEHEAESTYEPAVERCEARSD